MMLHLLSAAVNPQLGLAKGLRLWPSISAQLREPPRRRKLQTDVLSTKLNLY